MGTNLYEMETMGLGEDSIREERGRVDRSQGLFDEFLSAAEHDQTTSSEEKDSCAIHISKSMQIPDCTCKIHPKDISKVTGKRGHPTFWDVLLPGISY